MRESAQDGQPSERGGELLHRDARLAQDGPERAGGQRLARVDGHEDGDAAARMAESDVGAALADRIESQPMKGAHRLRAGGPGEPWHGRSAYPIGPASGRTALIGAGREPIKSGAA